MDRSESFSLFQNLGLQLLTFWVPLAVFTLRSAPSGYRAGGGTGWEGMGQGVLSGQGKADDLESGRRVV